MREVRSDKRFGPRPYSAHLAYRAEHARERPNAVSSVSSVENKTRRSSSVLRATRSRQRGMTHGPPGVAVGVPKLVHESHGHTIAKLRYGLVATLDALHQVVEEGVGGGDVVDERTLVIEKRRAQNGVVLECQT